MRTWKFTNPRSKLHNAVCYMYNALRFVYNALRYVHNALCFVYNALHYIVFCTEFQFKHGRTNKFTVKKYQLY